MEFLFKKWAPSPINRSRSINKQANPKIIDVLENLKREIQSLPCHLKETKNIVLSSGDFNSPIMFVGEAPGDEENQQKIPFLGANGKLLNKMLEAIGIDRDKVYMTNVFFWQPEQNRMPTQQELVMTLPLVEKHILLQKPQLIVTLGAVAAKTLLKITEGILSVRGTLQELTIENKKFPVFIACHPAYILRTHKISDYLEDFKNIQKYLKTHEIYSLVEKN